MLAHIKLTIQSTNNTTLVAQYLFGAAAVGMTASFLEYAGALQEGTYDQVA